MNLFVARECYTATRMYIIVRLLEKTLGKTLLSSYWHTLHFLAEAKRTKKSKQHQNIKVKAWYLTLRADDICIIISLILEKHQIPSHVRP